MFCNGRPSRVARYRCRVVAEINADAADWRREALARLEKGLPEDAMSRRHDTAMVVEGRPSQSILRIAQEEHAALIVMGVQSRGAIDRMLFGSTTREVIQAAHCPVISIRSDSNDPPWGLAAEAQLRVGA